MIDVAFFLAAVGCILFAFWRGYRTGRKVERAQWFTFTTTTYGRLWHCDHDSKPMPASYFTAKLQDLYSLHRVRTQIMRIELSRESILGMGFPQGPFHESVYEDRPRP